MSHNIFWVDRLKRVSLRVVTGLVLTAILLTALAAYFAWAATPSTDFWISPGVYPGAPSYTIWRDGSNYFAKDQNGYQAFSGTNASLLFQHVVNALTSGGRVWVQNGIYLFDTTVIVNRSSIYFEGENLGHHTLGSRPNTAVTFKLTTAGIPLFKWTNTSRQVYFGGMENIHLWGGSLASGTGILVDGASDLRFEYVFVDYFGTHGFDFNATTYGIWNVWLVDCLSESNGGIGYYFRTTYNFGIEGIWMQNSYSNNNTHSIYIHGAGGDQPARNILIEGGRYVAAREDAIAIEGNNSYRIIIEGNRIFDYGKNNATWNAGIRIGINNTYPFDIQVVDNIIGDIYAALPKRNAVKLEGHCMDIEVTANNFVHQASSNINRTSDGGGLKIHHNHGFNTENSGGVSFSAETTKWVIHSLSGTPTSIVVTMQGDINGDYWISDRNSTHFQITLDSSQTVDAFWSAIYVP